MTDPVDPPKETLPIELLKVPLSLGSTPVGQAIIREGIEQDFGANLKGLLVGMEKVDFSPEHNTARVRDEVSRFLKDTFARAEAERGPEPTLADMGMSVTAEGSKIIITAPASGAQAAALVAGLRDFRAEAGAVPKFGPFDLAPMPIRPFIPLEAETPLLRGMQTRYSQAALWGPADPTGKRLVRFESLAFPRIRRRFPPFLRNTSPRGPGPFELRVREAFARSPRDDMGLIELGLVLFPASPLRDDARAGFTKAGDSVMWLRMVGSQLERLVRARVLSCARRPGLPSVYTLASP